jgi:L-ascorbate metabolism protein UlaG (beta-lactamase superfamily)
MTDLVSITYIGTATSILTIDGLTLLTDPVFAPAGSSLPTRRHASAPTESSAPLGDATTPRFASLTVTLDPALKIEELPPIDAVLLSHEDHPDNLDDAGRQLLFGRRVLTTLDGAKQLGPRPGVKGLKAWETYELTVGEKTISVMGTPCDHLPGGECTGFVLSSPTLGVAEDGKPNAIYITGDTVYMSELKRIGDTYHVAVLILHAGGARGPDGRLLTMNGDQAVQLVRDLEPDVVVPVHYEGWKHFVETKEELKEAFERAGLGSRVNWLEGGVSTSIF